MIAIINYGMGNIGSIVNMLHKIGVEAVITNTPEELETADRIILPGVGSFDHGMNNLEKLNLVPVIKQITLKQKKPFLGICLGLQLLGRASEEGTANGLGLIPFNTVKFRVDSTKKLKIPHMGWNISKQCFSDHIFKNIKNPQRYYFVHSYHAVCDDPSHVLMTCDYGYEFAAALKKDNIYGVQFHPEKSHKFGMALLENFVKEC